MRLIQEHMIIQLILTLFNSMAASHTTDDDMCLEDFNSYFVKNSKSGQSFLENFFHQLTTTKIIQRKTLYNNCIINKILESYEVTLSTCNNLNYFVQTKIKGLFSLFLTKCVSYYENAHTRNILLSERCAKSRSILDNDLPCVGTTTSILESTVEQYTTTEFSITDDISITDGINITDVLSTVNSAYEDVDNNIPGSFITKIDIVHWNLFLPIIITLIILCLILCTLVMIYVKSKKKYSPLKKIIV